MRSRRKASILVLPKYERNGASSRLRTYQYEPFLHAEGFSVEYAPLFDASYLQRLYSERRAPAHMLAYYARRIKRLISGDCPDLIWLEKEAFPWWPFAAEQALLPHGVPIVSDYDDAIHIRYEQHPRSTVRASLGTKIEGVMRHSALVLAGNEFLSQRARASGAKRIETTPTVIDVSRYDKGRSLPADGRKVVVGWIGSPLTWQAHAASLVPLLSEFVEAGLITVMAVGTHSKDRWPGFEFCEWSEAAEVDLIRGMDIGVMPLPDDDWSRGKCGYKLIQYMGCELPVIASPVGANRTIVRHGESGFLAETEAEWREAIARLVADPELRASFGERGGRIAREEYSLQVWGPRVARMLHELVGGPS